MWLSNQKCMTRHTLLNLHPNEYSQGFHYYQFTVKLDTCVVSCNTLNDLSNKVCVLNKTEDLYLSMFNMIAGINKSKTLTKHISCEGICRLYGKNVIHINGGIMINANVSTKNFMYVKKIMFGILVHVVVKTITCDEEEETKTIPTNFNEKKTTCKKQNFSFYLPFY